MTDSPVLDEGPGIIESAWRYRTVVLVGVILGAVLGYLIAVSQPEVYEAQTRIVVADPVTSGLFGDSVARVSSSDSSRFVRNQAEQIASEQVRDATAEQLGVAELGEDVDITATPSEDSDSVTITVRHPDGRGAASTADAVVRAYDEVATSEVAASADRAASRLRAVADELVVELADLDRRLQQDGDNAVLVNQYSDVAAQLAEVRRRIRTIEVDADLFGSGVRITQEAEVPTSPSQPRPIRTAALGAFLGISLTTAFSLWANGKRRDPKELAAGILGVPLLGEIPEFGASLRSSLPVLGAAGGLEKAMKVASFEPYSYLMASLSLALRDIDGNVVVVTSMAAGEGKSLTSLNLALASAAEGKKTLLLDADVHRSQLKSVIPQIGEAPALHDLDEGADMVALQWPVAHVQNLYVMRVGGDREVEPSFFRSARFRSFLQALGEEFEFVVIDSAPVVPVLDTIDVAEAAHGMIVIVTPSTTESLLIDGKRRLDHVSRPILGYAVNRSEDSAATSAYGYGYRKTQVRRRRTAADDEAQWRTPRAVEPVGVSAAAEQTSLVVAIPEAHRPDRTGS